MKTAAVFVAVLASTSAFAPPAQQRTSSTSLAAKPVKKAGEAPKKRFMSSVFGMDLFAPNPTVNEYGSRGKKNMKTGKITAGKSYVPAGLSADQYSKIRGDADKKKAANYQKNVKKAGIFEDYTDYYIKRGTDTKDDWKKSVTLGHRMAKTKYDYSGAEEAKGYDGSSKSPAKGKKFFGKK